MILRKPNKNYIENVVYQFLMQLWLVLMVKLLEIHSNGCFPEYLNLWNQVANGNKEIQRTETILFSL